MKINKSNKVAIGITLIFSGIIILCLTALLSVITNFVFASSGGGVLKNIVNIITWATGTLGFFMLFIGPIAGTIVLVKKY